MTFFLIINVGWLIRGENVLKKLCCVTVTLLCACVNGKLQLSETHAKNEVNYN